MWTVFTANRGQSNWCTTQQCWKKEWLISITLTNMSYTHRGNSVEQTYCLMNSHSICTIVAHADPDGHTLFLQRKCNKRNVFHKLP